MKTLLAYRNYSGIGDWLMGLTVLKMVNSQYPEIDIYLNLMAKSAHKYRKEYKVVPQVIKDLVKNTDVKISNVTFYSNIKACFNDYDYVSNLKYHKREGKFFIESMVNNFNRFTGLELKYDPQIYAQYQGKAENIINKPYILIQACSKRHNHVKNWKDYGSDRMDIIAGHLKSVINVIQIGAQDDIQLQNAAGRCLGTSLETLYSVMKNCLCFVGLDGMLGCYAAHHKVRQYIIYSGKFNMNWTNFPYRTQINGNRENPDDIARIVMNSISLKEVINA